MRGQSTTYAVAAVLAALVVAAGCGDSNDTTIILGPTAGGPTPAEAEQVGNCPGGGTRTDDEGLLIRTITLDACDVSDPQLGSFEFDGTITINFTAGTIDFDITASDLTHDRDVDFVGTLNGTV